MKTSSHKVVAFRALSSTIAQLVVKTTKGDLKREMPRLNSSLKPFNLKAVAGSAKLLPLKSEICDYYQITASVSRSAKPASAVEKARLTAVAGNMFIDGDEQIWDEVDGMLIRRNTVESAEHLERLLASVCPPTVAGSKEGRQVMQTVASADYTTESGDYVVFVTEATVMDGFVVATSDDESRVMVLPRPDDYKNPYQAITIDRRQVLSKVDASRIAGYDKLKVPEERKVIEAADMPKLSQVLAFYKKFYGYNKDFWVRFSSMLKDRNLYPA